MLYKFIPFAEIAFLKLICTIIMKEKIEYNPESILKYEQSYSIEHFITVINTLIQNDSTESSIEDRGMFIDSLIYQIAVDINDENSPILNYKTGRTVIPISEIDNFWEVEKWSFFGELFNLAAHFMFMKYYHKLIDGIETKIDEQLMRGPAHPGSAPAARLPGPLPGRA